MGRVRRVDVGGMVYHVLNGANFRSRLFKKEAHYQDFLGLMRESLDDVAAGLPRHISSVLRTAMAG